MSSSKTGLVFPLLELVEGIEAGTLPLELYFERLTEAETVLAGLRGRMLGFLDARPADAPAETYRDGLLREGINDAFSLLAAGLRELRTYANSRDRTAVRMGRLVLEKGEQEYRATLSALLGPDALAENTHGRTTNLWGQVTHEAARMCSGQSTETEWTEALAFCEWALNAHMEGTFRDFQRALARLKAEPSAIGEADEVVFLSLRRLSTFLGVKLPEA